MQVQTSLSAAHFPAHLKSWIDIAKAWSRQAVRQHHSYRPEKHYMRGPGPKWHEKHAPKGDSANGRRLIGLAVSRAFTLAPDYAASYPSAI